MSRGLRRGVLASFVFIIAGIGGAVGNHVTGKITPTAVVFVILLIIGALAAVLLDRVASSGASKESQATPGMHSVDARGSNAFQIGDHNVQINHQLPDAPRDL